MKPLLLALVPVLLAGCATIPDPRGPAVITGTVKSVAGKPLAGLILLERGELHGNVWDRGTLVDAEGRFRIELPRGGQYGLHLYSSGYFYRPQAIEAEAGKTLDLELKLAPEPTRERDPVIRRVAFLPGVIQLEVADPDDNLGPQVMAFNVATRRAHAMDPPVPVKDLKANFPQGVYQLKVDGAMNPADWHFVVADHACWTSDILAFPHDPKPAQVVR